MPESKIGIGQAGFGGIGKVHAHAYRSIAAYYPGVLPEVRMAGVCTQSEASAARAVREGGFARGYSRIDRLLADPEVTVVDCSLPNHLHKEVILSALAARKHVYCEKPLCLAAAEAREIQSAAKTSSLKIGMTFNYRFVPAIVRAKQLIEEGAIGDLYNFHFVYLHTGYQDQSRPLSWRMQRGLSGGGALADLGSHIIDLARYLLGELSTVFATQKTFITERPRSSGAPDKGPVDVDDAMWLQARLASGAIGTMEVSRFATGSLDDLRFRIEGTKGALKFDLMDANWLYWYDGRRRGGDLGGERGWVRLETASHFSGAAIPTPRSILGWERSHAENQFRFLKSITEGTEPSPGLADGVAVQLVMDAAYRSAESGRWVDVPSE